MITICSPGRGGVDIDGQTPVQEAVTLSDRIVVMTARPGRIKAIMPVALAHPRDFQSEDFRRIEQQVYAQLDEELAKTFSLEGVAG